MPPNKKSRVQAYLEPELAEIIRNRAAEEGRPESREVSRLVRLGLEVDATGYMLGGIAFRTKADVQAHVRAVRDATQLGDRIDDPAVLDLLSLHPEWDEKTAGGGWIGTALINHPAKRHSTKEIAILFNDSDKVVDISWTKLLPFLRKGINAPIKAWDCRLSELRLAARQEVEEQIDPLREGGYEVDHVFPLTFEQLLYNWMSYEHYKVSDVLIGHCTGVDTARYFACPTQQRSWKTFHKDHAVLETIKVAEHKQRTSRSNIDWSSLL